MSYIHTITTALLVAFVTSGWWMVGTKAFVTNLDPHPAIIVPTVLATIFAAISFGVLTLDNWRK